MIELLAAGPRCPQELADELDVTQQSASSHLQVLYPVGLVSRRCEGTRVLYDLTDQRIIELLDRLAVCAPASFASSRA